MADDERVIDRVTNMIYVSKEAAEKLHWPPSQPMVLTPIVFEDDYEYDTNLPWYNDYYENECYG